MQSKYDVELPQSIIESFARFLVPELRRYYSTEQNELEENSGERQEQDTDQ